MSIVQPNFSSRLNAIFTVRHRLKSAYGVDPKSGVIGIRNPGVVQLKLQAMGQTKFCKPPVVDQECFTTQITPYDTQPCFPQPTLTTCFTKPFLI